MNWPIYSWGMNSQYTGQQTGWFPDPVWMMWRKISLAILGI